MGWTFTHHPLCSHAGCRRRQYLRQVPQEVVHSTSTFQAGRFQEWPAALVVHVLLHLHTGQPAPPQQGVLLLPRRARGAVKQLQRHAERSMGLHLKVHLKATNMWVLHTSNKWVQFGRGIPLEARPSIATSSRRS